MALSDNKLRQKYGCVQTHPFPCAVKGGEHIFQGALVGVIAGEGLLMAGHVDGYGDFIGMGVAEYECDAQLASDGELYCHVIPGRWGGFASAADADEVTIANIGQTVYCEDDNTVALTDGSGTRGPAGKVIGVDDRGKLILSLGGDLG